MDLAIASYSFHRMLESGSGTVFDYIDISRRLGCRWLDPWAAHLTDAHNLDTIARVGSQPGILSLLPGSEEFTGRIEDAARVAGLPFGCIAVDGGHIYEDDPAERARNRQIALAWLDVAARLGAQRVRIDAGGPPDMPPAIFSTIVEGYRELVGVAQEKGIEILFENHWGPTLVPENIIRLVEAVDGLGLLFDSNNFVQGRQREGWRMVAPYARSVHIKTFAFDADGNETTTDIPRCIDELLAAGYRGVWSVESCPLDGDEPGAVERTLDLIRRCVGEN